VCVCVCVCGVSVRVVCACVFLRVCVSVVCACVRTLGARGGAVGCTVPLAGMSRVSFPMVSLEVFIGIILSAILWTLWSTECVTEMVTRDISGGKSDQCVWLTLSSTCADCHEIW